MFLEVIDRKEVTGRHAGASMRNQKHHSTHRADNTVDDATISFSLALLGGAAIWLASIGAWISGFGINRPALSFGVR